MLIADYPPSVYLTREQVQERVFRALRTLRCVRGRVGPAGHYSAMPRPILEFSDYTAAQLPDGRIVSRDQYPPGYGPPEAPPIEDFEPTPRDFDLMEEPLRWFAAIDKRPPNRRPGMSLTRPTRSMSTRQRVIWLRSYAYERPLSYRGIGLMIGVSEQRAAVAFKDGVEALFIEANRRVRARAMADGGVG